MREKKRLTTNAGARVPVNQTLMAAGPCGPLLVQARQLFLF